MLRSVLRRPILRVGIVRCKPRQNGFVVRRLILHIFHGGFGFLQPPVGFLPLLADDGVPRAQIFLGFLQQAQAAVFLNVLDGRAAALQALDVQGSSPLSV